MHPGKGSFGISHALPVGQGQAKTPGTAFREGIRPIALQPMESHGGVGRNMEGMRAESDRSIREMNAGGPAKANLLAAQMKDVDGKPLGRAPGFGGPNLGNGSQKPGFGGGPNNSNGYNVAKPWWWDMMQARSQKMWDLMYYKPREMFYTNLYKIGLGIFNCLATGSKDGDISNFFGKGGNSDDLKCTTKKMQSFKKFVQTAPTTKTTSKDGAKEEQYDTGLAQLWFELCPKKPDGTPGWEAKETDDKNFFQVRAECMGFDVLLDWIKGWVKKEYDTNCDTVTIDGINEFSINAKRKGIFDKEAETNERLNKKAVIALIAKPKYKGITYENGKYKREKSTYKIDDTRTESVYDQHYDSNEYVVAVVNDQSFSMSKEQMDTWHKEHPYCKLSKVISFISSDGVWGNRVSRQLRTDEDAKARGRDNAPRNSVNRSSETAPGRFFHPYASGVGFSLEYCKGKNDSNTKRRALTYQELKNKLDPKKNSVNQCPIPSPEQFVKNMYLSSPHLQPKVKCSAYTPRDLWIDDDVEAEAIIKDASNHYVFAVVVEQLTGMKHAEVRWIKNFGKVSIQSAKDGGQETVSYTYNETDGFHFYLRSHLGVEGFNQTYGTATALSQVNPSRQEEASVQNRLNDNSKEITLKRNESVTSNYETCVAACNKAHPNGQATQVPVREITNADRSKSVEYRTETLADCLGACPQNYSEGNQSGIGGSGDGIDLIRGDGKIFWVVTSNKSLNEKIKEGAELDKGLDELRPSDFVEDFANTGVCHYAWCNDAASCTNNNRDNPEEHYYCQENGQGYLTQKITLKGKDYYIKIRGEDAPPAVTVAPEDAPPCAKLCKDADNNLYECDENGIPDGASKCPYSAVTDGDKPTVDEFVTTCRSCCNYERDGQNYISIKIGKNFYITDANPGKCSNPEDSCTPAAWSKEGHDLYVYSMSHYDPGCLELVPQESAEPFQTANCMGTNGKDCSSPVVLQRINEKHFWTIHDQSYHMEPNSDPSPASGPNKNPKFFELFPQLTLPEDIEVDLSACAFCGPSLYSNADVQASERTIEEITGKLRRCFNKIHELEAKGATKSVQKLKTIYFYGYASKRGSHDPRMIPGFPRTGCTTSDAGPGYTRTQWDKNCLECHYLGDCNKALSEDRNLYIMDQLISRLDEFKIEVDIQSTKKYDGLRGFTNTIGPVQKTGSRPSYRLIKHPSTSGKEFKFVSKPYGSEGAAKEYNDTIANQRPDRLVVIAPIGGEWENPRITCEGNGNVVDEKLREIEQEIKEELRLSESGRQATHIVTSRFVTATESDEPLTLEEEFGQIKETPIPSWMRDEEEEPDTFTQDTRKYSTLELEDN